MKKKSSYTNGFAAFSRGGLAVIMIAAVFCGICGLGAAFSQIPWLVISGGLCLLAILFTAIWALGFKSHSNKPASADETDRKPHKAFDQDNGELPPREAFDYEKS